MIGRVDYIQSFVPVSATTISRGNGYAPYVKVQNSKGEQYISGASSSSYGGGHASEW